MNNLFRRTAMAACGMLLAAMMMGQAQDKPADTEKENAAKAAPLPILRLDADGPVSRITSLVFSPDGKTLYAGGLDKMVYAWTMNAQGQFQFAPGKSLRIPIGPDISGSINAMALTSDGRYLAVGGQAVGRRFTGFREGGLIFPASAKSVQDRLDTGTIYVFDLSDPAQPKLIHLRGHLGTVILLAFAPSAKNQPPVLVSAAEEYNPATGNQRGAVRVWNLDKPEKSLAEKFDLVAPSSLKDSKGNPINLPRAIAALRMGNAPAAVQVGIAWGDNVLRVWDVAKNNTVELANLSTVACAGVDNTFLLAGGYRRGADGKAGWHLGLWKPPVAKAALPAKAERPLMEGTAPIGLATDSKTHTALTLTLQLNGERKVGFFLADSQTLKRVPANSKDILFGDSNVQPAFTISPQGDLVAVAGNVDRKIRVYHADRNQGAVLAQVLEGQGDTFPLVRFYRKEQSLGLGLRKTGQAGKDPNQPPDLIFDLTDAVAVEDNAKAGWNPAPAKPGISAKAGQQADRKTVVIDLGAGKTTTIILPKEQTFVESEIALCPKTENHPPLVGLIVQSRRFAESILRVYNAETGDRLRQFSGHSDTITSIAFSDDGKLLASTSLDRTVRVWWMEDLKANIGKHGFLDNLFLTDKNNLATVKEIDEFARADIKAGLRVDDVIEGFTGPDQKFVATAKSAMFYYYLSMVPPVSEADGKPNSVLLQVRRGNQRLANSPKIQVQQGVDERKPLFTLFFKEGQAGVPSWIGWSPVGPFDSSDPNIETLVGWHFNPPNPEASSTFAQLSEYRKDHYTKGLFKKLIETGELPKTKEEKTATVVPPPVDLPKVDADPAVIRKPEGVANPTVALEPVVVIPPAVADKPKVVIPPAIAEKPNTVGKPPFVFKPEDFRTPKRPAVDLALFIQETKGQGDAQETASLTTDSQQRVWASTKKLKALFSVTGLSAVEVRDKIIWKIDGKQQRFPVVEPIGGLFEADLSGFPWQPKPNAGSYNLRVSFVDERIPQEHALEQAIVFAPPPPPPPPPMKKLPSPWITSPDLLTVLYDSQHQKQILVTVNLAAVDDAPLLAGQVTFEVNGKPIRQQDGKLFAVAFDEKPASIRAKLPLVNGENRIRGGLPRKMAANRIFRMPWWFITVGLPKSNPSPPRPTPSCPGPRSPAFWKRRRTCRL